MLRMRAGVGGMEWNGMGPAPFLPLAYCMPCPACLLPGNRRRARGHHTLSLNTLVLTDYCLAGGGYCLPLLVMYVWGGGRGTPTYWG